MQVDRQADIQADRQANRQTRTDRHAQTDPCSAPRVKNGKPKRVSILPIAITGIRTRVYACSVWKHGYAQEHVRSGCPRTSSLRTNGGEQTERNCKANAKSVCRKKNDSERVKNVAIQNVKTSFCLGGLKAEQRAIKSVMIAWSPTTRNRNGVIGHVGSVVIENDAMEILRSG